ncbi:MAG TPA: hypothetical protein VEW42_04295 [Candidatus Eisenbacteria bacterium]|nr:hypothetical protein [Candidatus Eisenbacteria bacterium]
MRNPKFQETSNKQVPHYKSQFLYLVSCILYPSRYSERGQSLVELLITIGIATILIPALFAGIYTSRAGRAQQDQRLQATALARQTIEATRIVRDTDWGNFAVNGTYHPVVSGTTWVLASGSAVVNGFTQKVVISDAYRDSNGNLAQSGTLDPSVRQVTATISWNTPIPADVSLVSYFTRLKSVSYTQTTYADFTAGANSGTTIDYTNGSATDGEVELGAGGTGNWCNPNQTPILTFDLTRQGVPTSISATYSASMVHAYTTSGFNASGYSLDSQQITDNPSPTPPVISSGPFYDQWKTYGIFATKDYVYTTTNHPGLSVDIENVSGSTFTQAATYDGGGTGLSVTTSGTTGYVTVGSNLKTFSITNLSGSLSTVGTKSLAGQGNKVVVVGGYAYVATSYVSTNTPKGQLQIINVSNPSNMSISATVNVGNNLDGVDVFVNQTATYAYLVTKYASGQKDFYIIDISNKSVPVIHGSYSTNGMTPTGVLAVSGNRAIIVGTGGQPYQVLSVKNIDSPTYCMPQGFALSGVSNINAISTITEPDGDAYSFILTDNSSAELQIIEGGPGGQFAQAGIFTSSVFATNSAAFNRFDSTTDTPSGTSITYQVAVANKVSGSCPTASSSYTYVGPNGTSALSDVFTSSGILPLVNNSGAGYANPGQCLRYKAYLSSEDTTLTPVLEDITFSYSP